MEKHLNIVGFIPARGGSKGVPMKNLTKINGIPLVARSILSLQVAGVDEVYVSTDNDDIKNVALRYGAKVIDRPSFISDDNASSESAITHFLQQIDCDVVVFVQCTSPLLTSTEIKMGIYKFQTYKYDSLFSAVKTNDTLIWKKDDCFKEDIAAINYDPQNRSNRQNRKESTIFIETGGFFIFKAKEYMQERCRMFGKVGYSEVSYWNSFQIDSIEDLENIKKLMEN